MSTLKQAVTEANKTTKEMNKIFAFVENYARELFFGKLKDQKVARENLTDHILSEIEQDVDTIFNS